MYPFGAILEIQKTLYKHVAVYLGNGMVLQNHHNRGEEVVPLYVFSQGSSIAVRPDVVDDPSLLLQRAQWIASNPKPYNLFSNNCEHTVYRAVSGKSWSPQLAMFGALFILGAAGLAIARAK